MVGLDLRRDKGIAARLADSDTILGIIVEDVVHLRLRLLPTLLGISCGGDALVEEEEAIVDATSDATSSQEEVS